MTYSDIVSGILLVLCGYRTLRPGRPFSIWACCGVGVWLTFAPVLFWSPLNSAYVNDTLVGALVIALTILIPGMPNMILYMQMGPDTPKGWSYNPSSWPQRWIMIVTGFLGWIVSRYLATYQLGYSEHVWDPFFGFSEGTKKVLDSKMSHGWPISDAGLGTISYTFEFLMGWMGSPSRWRTMPWMVAFFGILVIPLGLTHIILVISQPLVVGHWCTMCLLAAAIMLPMIPLEVDEVMAMIQHMKEAKARGDRNGSLWTVFWKGGSAEGSTEDKRSPKLLDFPAKPKGVFLASIWGFSFPWTLCACVLLGLWIMFMPLAFGTSQSVSHLFHLSGALVITFSTLAMGEVIRIIRFVNILLAVSIAGGLFFLKDGDSHFSLVVAIITSGIIALLSLPKGTVKESFGVWDQYIK